MSKRERTTKKQIETMVSFITENTEMACSVNSGEEVEKNWEKLKNILNSLDGPKRSIKQWKTVFADLKTNTKRKARINRVALEGTGGGPNTNKQLTEIENRVLSLIKPVTIEGVEEVAEPGLEGNVEFHNIENIEILTMENIVIEENNPINEAPTPKVLKKNYAVVQHGAQLTMLI